MANKLDDTAATGAAAAGDVPQRSTEISYVLSLTVKNGQQANVEPLLNEMVVSTAGEQGTLHYEFYVAGDTVHAYERFADNDAVMAHLAGFGEKYAERFLAVFAVQGLTLYGPADDRVREATAGFGAVPMTHLAGFKR